MNNLDALKMAYMSQMGNGLNGLLGAQSVAKVQPNIVVPYSGSPSPYGKPIIGEDGLAYNPRTYTVDGDEWHNQLGREQVYLPRTDAMQMGNVGDTRQDFMGTMRANISDDDYNRMLEIINSLPMGDYGKI